VSWKTPHAKGHGESGDERDDDSAGDVHAPAEARRERDAHTLEPERCSDRERRERRDVEHGKRHSPAYVCARRLPARRSRAQMVDPARVQHGERLHRLRQRAVDGDRDGTRDADQKRRGQRRDRRDGDGDGIQKLARRAERQPEPRDDERELADLRQTHAGLNRRPRAVAGEKDAKRDAHHLAHDHDRREHEHRQPVLRNQLQLAQAELETEREHEQDDADLGEHPDRLGIDHERDRHVRTDDQTREHHGLTQPMEEHRRDRGHAQHHSERFEKVLRLVHLFRLAAADPAARDHPLRTT
jgi:hypothetical protein